MAAVLLAVIVATTGALDHVPLHQNDASPDIAAAAITESPAVAFPRGGAQDAGVAGILTVTFLDVGQGDAILLQGPNVMMLVDAGRHDRSDVVPQLHSLGVTHIDLLVGTHPHADHIGQMDKVLQSFPVTEVWLNGAEHTTRTYERVIDAILASGAGYHEPRTGEQHVLGSLEISVLHPGYLSGDANDDSIVLRVVYGDVAFLLTGDAEAGAESQMLASGQPLDAQILKVGHHGSNTSTTAAFPATVSPDIAVYSASTDNSYGHPHREPLERLAQQGVEVYGTAVHGTVVVTTDGKSYEVSTHQTGSVTAASNGNAVSAPSSAAPPQPASEPPVESAAPEWCIDINAASLEELQGIIHIGPDRAGQIINLRPFRSVDDLTRVKGIAAVRLGDIKAQGLACVR